MKINRAVASILIAAVAVLGSCTKHPAAPEEPITVTGFSPESGPAGTVVTITGSGFGTSPGEIIADIGDVPMTITSVTPERVEATIPDGASSGIISVTRKPDMTTVTLIIGKSDHPFTVIPPAQDLTNVSPAAAAPGEGITITGKGFGASKYAVTVLIGQVELVPDMVSDTLLRATLPLSLSAGLTAITVQKEKIPLKGSLRFTVKERPRPPYSSFEFSLAGITGTQEVYYEKNMPDRQGRDTSTASYASAGSVQCGTLACGYRTGDTLELTITNEDVAAGSGGSNQKQVTFVLDRITHMIRYLKYRKQSSYPTGTTTKSYGTHDLMESVTIRDAPYQELPDGSLRCTLDAAALAAAGLDLKNTRHTLTVDGAFGTRDLYESRMIGFDIPAGASLTLTLKP